MKKTEFREDGIYHLDYDELEALKKKNMEKGKLKMLYMTREQQDFLIKYWYFLTPTERSDYLEKIFPGKTYQSVVKRVEMMARQGIKFERPYKEKEKDEN
jgi:hypothetical protein